MLNSSNAATAAACAATCAGTTGCVGFSWSNGLSCYPKNGNWQPKMTWNGAAGFLQSRHTIKKKTIIDYKVELHFIPPPFTMHRTPRSATT